MKIIVIAELAQGFEGISHQAKLLLRAARNAGADAAKFQLVYADELATPDYKYYELFKSLEMSDESWRELSDYATELGIELQMDIFGKKGLILAEEIGVKTIKLHGTDIANLGLLNVVAKSSVERVLLGSGGAHLSELEEALHILKSKNNIILLGFQGYPTPGEDNQLLRVKLLKDRFCEHGSNVEVGFADHSDPLDLLGYALPALAIGLGATVIEKHLTLGKNMMLEDHEAALNPDEFAQFTRMIVSCTAALGTSVFSEDFGMSDSEKKYRAMIRRHAVAANDLKAGSILKPADVVLKRTSSEVVITQLSDVYNKTINKDIIKNTAVSPNDINI